MDTQIAQIELSFCYVFIDQINEMYVELSLRFFVDSLSKWVVFFLKAHHWEEDIKYASEERSLAMILGKNIKKQNKTKQSKNKKQLDLEQTD